MYEMIDLINRIKWIIFIPIITGITREIIKILLRIAREPPRITDEEIENKTKDLDIDEDLKKYFDYKE